MQLPDEGFNWDSFLSRGLDAWVDVERIRNYMPNDPTPGSYGPAGYAPAGVPAFGGFAGGAGVPVLLIAGAAVLVLLLLLKR